MTPFPHPLLRVPTPAIPLPATENRHEVSSNRTPYFSIPSDGAYREGLG